jgi:hypothetical protein
MGFFKEMEGSAAILVESGIYKQTPLYTRDGFLYAKTAGGFVRLMADGSTTKARLRLDFLSCSDTPLRDPLGRLCTADATGAKALEPAKAQLLLGAPE